MLNKQRRGRKSSTELPLSVSKSKGDNKTPSKWRVQRPLQPFSNSPDPRRHRPNPIPTRTAGGKAVPASGRRRERARRASRERKRERERSRGIDQTEGADESLSRAIPRWLSPSRELKNSSLLPVSRPSARRSSPLARGATRTSPSSWPAGDTSDSATQLLLSSATPLLLGWRCSRSWWRASLWKRRRRRRKMRTRASADLLRRRRR